MFFEGSLQEGIAAALLQGKPVACFVTDDGEESRTWLDDYMQDAPIKNLLSNQAILMRLEAGSDEAGHLAAIFPLPKTPTLVIIKNGDLKGYITSATTTPAPSSSAAATTPSLQTPPQTHQPSTNTAALRAVMAERRARLEARRLEEERSAKESRAARAASAATDPAPEAVEKRRHAETLRKQRQDAADERNRILRRIEDDKLARQARSAAAREPKLGDVAGSLASAASSTVKPAGGQAAIQVRLFDGSSLRTRFESTEATLKTAVRAWVDDKRTDGQAPYTFKIVAAPPRPSRRVDETEEGKTLAELGLTPSATLMLAPVKKYAEAYQAPRRGLLKLPLVLFGSLIGLLAWLWGLVRGMFSGSSAGRAERERAREEKDREEAEAQAAQVREQRKGKFSQLANLNQRDQQLYNGNSLNFEPRPDEEET
ncbi:UBX domain-containing protein 7 like [Verticillium longisporum]|uniref:UBX domain-containing protein 7 like n=1 Tax=Verticillium longisporum TaxID=100787 RepID=A0A8I2Z6K0_VERLO|nr:UBX domain-containing protein 7 like [Verticillium longisporum]